MFPKCFDYELNLKDYLGAIIINEEDDVNILHQLALRLSPKKPKYKKSTKNQNFKFKNLSIYSLYMVTTTDIVFWGGCSNTNCTKMV